MYKFDVCMYVSLHVRPGVFRVLKFPREISFSPANVLRSFSWVRRSRLDHPRSTSHNHKRTDRFETSCLALNTTAPWGPSLSELVGVALLFVEG